MNATIVDRMVIANQGAVVAQGIQALKKLQK